ncbi:MAG: hypothetical protein NTY88_12470, partial [Bacteroidetes bacterium]|nr:hypothetical protein [Bacteroidota bacterium]
GLVEVIIYGTLEPGVLSVVDNDRLHYGKCITAYIRGRNIDSLVMLKLDCGTLLVPLDTSIQTMVVTHDVLFPLNKGADYKASFYAMCAQMHDFPPWGGKMFQLGEMADGSLYKLAHYIEKSHMQNIVGQFAVWAYTDNTVFDTLKLYGADSLSLSQTIEILDAVNVKTKLNDKPVVIKHLSPLIQINRYYLFGGIGLIALLSFVSVYLFFTRSTRDET